MSNVNDILNMRWASNDNTTPEDKQMGEMHNKPKLQALRANLPAEQRQLMDVLSGHGTFPS